MRLIHYIAFINFVRMELDLTKSSLWISVAIGAIIVAAASAGFQQYSAEKGSDLNVKGIVRDAILGGIFVAMAWTLVPESMTSITEKVTTSVTATVAKAPEIDVQVGPATF
jgi:hypothetical protein